MITAKTITKSNAATTVPSVRDTIDAELALPPALPPPELTELPPPDVVVGLEVGDVVVLDEVDADEVDADEPPANKHSFPPEQRKPGSQYPSVQQTDPIGIHPCPQTSSLSPQVEAPAPEEEVGRVEALVVTVALAAVEDGEKSKALGPISQDWLSSMQSSPHFL